MTTLVLPELVSVADLAMLCPRATLPKANEAGLASTFPAATAVPETATSTSAGTMLLLLVRAILPEG